MKDGFYVVEVEGKRTIAERCGSEWYQCGVDYDVWQYRYPSITVRVLCYLQIGEKDDLIIIHPITGDENGQT